jgi:SAM-dependent methyltransferase
LSEHVEPSPYDPIAGLYDRWNQSVVEDVGFYVDEAVASRGPVLELGVGTGRIAVPIALTGVRVIGLDSSAPMLELCRERARSAGVDGLIDLRLGDLRNPPLTETVPLVISPFRAFLHLLSDDERLLTLTRIHDLLEPDGRFVFDVFTPTEQDVAETDGRWIEREPGIEERADWNWPERSLVLHVRGDEGETQMQLAWISAQEWELLLGRAGFELKACYGWFNREPHSSDEDMVFVAQRK